MHASCKWLQHDYYDRDYVDCLSYAWQSTATHTEPNHRPGNPDVHLLGAAQIILDDKLLRNQYMMIWSNTI